VEKRTSIFFTPLYRNLRADDSMSEINGKNVENQYQTGKFKTGLSDGTRHIKPIDYILIIFIQ